MSGELWYTIPEECGSQEAPGNCLAKDAAVQHNGTAKDGNGIGNQIEDTDSHITIGSMRIPQRKDLTILLVFSREDGPASSLKEAANNLGHTCHMAKTAMAAQENFHSRHHDIVFIDKRCNKAFDADVVCRRMQSSVKTTDYSVMVAVIKETQLNKDDSLLHILEAGFHKTFIESTHVSVCMNELQQLAHSEVKSQRKLRACGSFMTALDNVSDAVQITNDAHIVMYVNHMMERITGYTGEELVGSDSRQLGRCDRNKDIQDLIFAQTNNGKLWEGTYITQRKSGDLVPHHCRVLPVFGHDGKISQYVTVKSVSADSFKANGSVLSFPRKRDSVYRVHASVMETPISKVINMINAAQESSPLVVAQALDKVVEMLRTSELYAPNLLPQLTMEDDPMASDLVGGLVSQNMKRRMSGSEGNTLKPALPHTYNPNKTMQSPASLASLTPRISQLLDKGHTWDFDIISLEEATQNRPLLYLGLKTFMRYDACKYLRIDEGLLVSWLQLMESKYHRQNPYHNSTHAADVMQASAFFLECERPKVLFDTGDCVACLIAAVMHDIDHPARTNAFLINMKNNTLALLYNDQAVLESHHASLGFRLTLKDSNANIFKNLNREDYLNLRRSIVDMVLATEMKQHFEHLSKFSNSINKHVSPLSVDIESSGMDELVQVTTVPTGSSSDTGINQLYSQENRMLVKRMLIKCADVSNPLRPWRICKVWAERIAEEYFSQTAEEKSLGMPVVMPVFDKKTCSIPKSQTSFIDVFITDMFDAWDYYCDIPHLMENMQTNYQKWKDLEEKSRSGHDLKVPKSKS